MLLVLAAPALDRGADKARLDRDDGAGGRVAAPDLLDDQGVGAVVESAPAVLLGDDRAEIAHVAELLDEVRVEVLVAVVVTRDGHDLLVREVARGLLDEALLVGELEVDQVRSSAGSRGTLARVTSVRCLRAISRTP